jgi:WD40-like Beta Propeller Repeat
MRPRVNYATMNRGCAALAVFLFATSALAQTPADEWKSVTTAHFRLHYPVAYEAWSLRAASRLESIRDAVVAETGFAPTPVTDVLVVNPLAQANGATFPLLDTPRIVLFAEPAGPEDIIGDYSNWIDLLVVHEMTHMVHLVRPSRNPLDRVLEHILPIGPLALSAPRWVTEGYATVVEGRLTGSGRPSSTIRASILRKWAQSGRLPSYAQLQSDQRFLGMSMAYLVGSAYLEWLEARAGAGSLRKLWPRMSARQRRSFDQAFEGVFGDSPQRLYGIFTAELTERAVTVDRETRGDLREGELWQETSRDSGDPAVSPDGKQMAIVLRRRSKPSRLVVWSTAVPAEEEKKFEERLKKVLARDPEDVAPVHSKPLPRKAVHELVLPDGGDIESPRWMADGRILFGHRVPDREGDLHHDLFLWSPGGGGVKRVTRLGDVSEADPIPGGSEAVAVRTRDGSSQLVMVMLATGGVRPLTEPSLDRVYSHPRVSRDGRRIVFASHSSGSWHLVVRETAGGAETVFPADWHTSVAAPEWGPTRDDIFATVYRSGFIDINHFVVEGGAGVPVTRTSGGATQSAPSADGRLFFMSIEPDGYTVRVLNEVVPAPSREAFTRSLVPALPPVPPAATQFQARTIPPPRPYGIGRQEPDLILNGSDAPAAHTMEVGMRFGDVVGRFDTIAVAAVGSSASQRGATLATTWRGWPVSVAAQIYGMRERDQRQQGIEVRSAWNARTALHTLSAEAGVLGSRISTSGKSGRQSRNLTFAAASLRTRRYFGQANVDGALALGGEAGDAPHSRATGSAGVTLGGVRFGGAAEVDRAREDAPITLGGFATTIVPRSAVANRVLDPALPTATLSGTRYTGVEANATTGALRFFYRQHRLGTRLSMAGVEAGLSSPPMPLLKMPAMHVTIGAARILDEPLRNRTRAWIAIRLEP